MVDYPDIINLSREELVEEYCKLFDSFQDLKELKEADAQIIHELKRSLDTATAAEEYLSQELEQYASSDNNEIENELHKVQAELADAKRKYKNLEGLFVNLQQDYNCLAEENSKVIVNLEESLKRKEQLACEAETINFDDYLLRIQTLENENMDLLQKIQAFEECSVHYTLTIAEYEKNMEILKDQVLCLEENLKSKRADLEEKLHILESTQEQLAEANSKIAMLSAVPDNDRKGNSLFAEVDDQRQAMKQLLTAQKKNYIQMKKIYDESENEIRRLKRENISMRTELETCSAIFCNADKIYQNKLHERVRGLLNQNEELERKLKWTQEILKELAAGKGVSFLDSMLKFCKNETYDLKSQLHSVRIQNASLEEQLRNSQQDMARWRFESLKSRCVLIDREHLLTEHKISFKPTHCMDYIISEKDQREAKPRIVTGRRSSVLENIVHRSSITPSKAPIKEEIVNPQNNSMNNNLDLKKEQIEQLTISNDSTTFTSNNIEKMSEKDLSSTKVRENVYKEDNSKGINVIELDSSLDMSKNKQQKHSEDKENSNINSTDDMQILDNFAELRLKPPSPMRPSQKSLENQKIPAPPSRSILIKHNDLLFKDSNKNVKFSSNADTVHNLYPDASFPATVSTSVKTNDNSATSKLNSKSTVKQSRTKSNIVVRRIVVNSKHE